MEIHRPTLVVLAALACVLVSITIITYAPSWIIQNVIATNRTSTSSPSANSSNITLGSPQTYTEYDKITFKPAIVNGTHGIQASFTGGKAFITNSTGGAIYWAGRHDTSHAFTFQGIGHYGPDGKLRDTGTVFNFGGMVGIYKDVIDKNGNIITKVWLWK
jgi:hypothetical protein